MTNITKRRTAREMTETAMIAGLYAAVTFATFYISFGAVQYRISEALTVLPAFTGLAVPGLTLGCVIANLFGFIIGVNPLGLIDALVGASATLIAALLTRFIAERGFIKAHTFWRYLFCPLPPVILNAVIVGLELSVLFAPGEPLQFFTFAASVLIGEAVCCYALGVPLMAAIEKNDKLKKIFQN